jgi:hypothetical protein
MLSDERAVSVRIDNSPVAIARYAPDGSVSRISIWWKGEAIEIVPDQQNAATREFQRAHEVVAALLEQERRTRTSQGPATPGRDKTMDL